MARPIHPASEGAEALKRAVSQLGSQVRTARLLGITQGAVSKWLRKGLALPPEHVSKIEAATGISRHQLRPDIFGPAPVVIDSLPLLPIAGDADDMEPAR